MYEDFDAPFGAPQWVPLETPGWFRTTRLPTWPPSAAFPWFDDLLEETSRLEWWPPREQDIGHLIDHNYPHIMWNINYNWTPRPEDMEAYNELKGAVRRANNDMTSLEKIVKGDPDWITTQPMKVAVPPQWRDQGSPDVDESKPERDEIKPVSEHSIPDAYENKSERDKSNPVADQSITESRPVADDGAPAKPVTTYDEDMMNIDEFHSLCSDDRSTRLCFDVEAQGWTKEIYGNQRRGSGKKRPSGRYGQRGGTKNPNVRWHSMKAQAEREGWLEEFRQKYPHRSMTSGSNGAQPVDQ